MSEGAARVLFDSSGNAIKVTQDGSDYKYEFLGKLRNAAGTIVNPATEGTLSAADTKLGTIDGVLDAIKDTDGIKKITDPLPAGTNNIGDVDVASSALPAGAATEATLTSVKDTDGIKKITDALPAGDNNIGNVDVVSSALPAGAATEATLASIKDTDGVKKITDQLPAGTNEIGKVAQGTKAAAADAWPTVLYDSSGNAIKVTQDGSDYKYEFIGKLRNVAGTIFNPATEETLVAADTKLGTIDGVLDSIKDTDGIKKITDALPVGDNIIGRTKITDGTDVAEVVAIDGVLHLAAGKKNLVDSNNSTVAQLNGGIAFTGTGTDVSQYASVAITIHSDQDSADDGMIFEFSMDNTNWDDQYKFNIDASQSQTRRFQFPVTAQYFRVRYINGSTTTTAFRVQTVLHRENILTSIHRVEKVVHEDRSAELVKSVLIAQREGAAVQDFYPIQADVGGNLKVTTVGADIPSNPSAFILMFVENGGSGNLRVDGSVTPVQFIQGPTVTDEQWSLRELLLTFTADDFAFDGLSFGPNAALTNGFPIEVVKDGVATEVFRIKQNEDFIRVPGRIPLVNNTGPKDVLGAVLAFDGLILNEATNDFIRITINDDMTSVKFKYLTATVFAAKVL